MSLNKDDIEGCALSKIVAFRCFHIPHVISMITEEVLLRSWRGVVCTTSDHHSVKSPSTVGGPEVDLIHERTSYQIVLEK
jgi:hypothetical protein